MRTKTACGHHTFRKTYTLQAEDALKVYNTYLPPKKKVYITYTLQGDVGNSSPKVRGFGSQGYK